MRNEKDFLQNRKLNMAGQLSRFILIFTITAAFFPASCNMSSKKETIVIQTDTVKNAINSAVHYLVKNTREDGMFEYRINMDPTVKVKKKYNILRHAGAIYSLCMYYEIQPDAAVRSAIERAGKYLRDESIEPLQEEVGLLAIWSKPDINKSNDPLQAKLGGTGLGLVALLSVEKIHPGFTPLENLRKLGQFIVFMQKEDGNFYSKYIPSENGRDDSWESLYYPGEAALGLLMLYEKDPSVIWSQTAVKALMCRARKRKDTVKIPVDHWALLATAKLFSLGNIDLPQESREMLENHAIRICETILREQIDYAKNPMLEGGFNKEGKVTPTAIRLEGLLAALSFLPQNQKISEQINNAVRRGMSFLLRSQIAETEFAGAFPRAVCKIEQNTHDAHKFNLRSTEVRIDYVQHALSAMIQYLHLTENME